MNKRMRLTMGKMIGSSLQFRRYDHERHGVVETLTAETVVYVRPVFGLAKPGNKRPSEVAKFRSEKPKRARSRLGLMWSRAKKTAGGDA